MLPDITHDCRGVGADRPKPPLLFLAGALVLVPLLIAVCLYAFMRLDVIFSSVPFDMKIFSDQAHSFWHSGELYRRANEFYPAYLPGAAIYKFPPAYQLYIAPFIESGTDSGFYYFCYISNFFMYLLMVFSICFYVHKNISGSERNDQSRYLFLLYLSVSLIVSFLFEPFYNGIGLLSAEIFIAFSCVMAFVFLDRLPWFSGVLVAMASTAKIYPIFLLVYFFWARRLYFGVGFIAAVIVISALSWYFFGSKELLFYTLHIFPNLLAERPMGTTENMNIIFFFFDNGITHHFAENLFRGLRVLLLGFMGLVFMRANVGFAISRMLLYCYVLVTMIVLLPNYWIQYHVILLMPCLVVLGVTLYMRHYKALFVLSLAVFIMMSGSDLESLIFGYYVEGNYVDLANRIQKDGELIALAQTSLVATLIRYSIAWKPLAPYLLLAVNGFLVVYIKEPRQESL